MRFEKEDLILQKDTKPQEIYFVTQGEVLNMQTGRVFGIGSIIGQDDILFLRKRNASYKAVTMCQTMKLDRENFEMMCKEFPYIKKELLDDANFRALVARKQNDMRLMIQDGQSKKVVRKFNELS